MTLVKCSECGRAVSSNASACPGCGNPTVAPRLTVGGVRPKATAAHNNLWIAWASIAIAAVVGLLALIGALSGGSGSSVQAALKDKTHAVYLDPRQLASDPQAFEGQNVWVDGYARNVTQEGDYTWVDFVASVQGKTYSTEPLVVEIRPKATSFVSDECYRVYGVASGTEPEITKLTGVQNDVSALQVYAWEVSSSGANGSC